MPRWPANVCQTPPFTHASVRTHAILRGTHRAVCTAEGGVCELRPSPLAVTVLPSLRSRRVACARCPLGSNETVAIQRQIDLKQKTLDVSTETNTQARPLNTNCGHVHGNKHTVGEYGRFRRILILHGRRKCVYTSPAAVRRSERLVAALAPPLVSPRLVRCAGHC